MASKKFSSSRTLRIRKGVGRCMRKNCAAFLAAKELKVKRGLQQGWSGCSFKESQSSWE